MYVGIANRAPAKLWGILNTKYVTSQSPLNESEFTLAYTATPCATCFPDTPDFAKAWGPYVYENNRALPRAFVPSRTMLVLGSGEDLLQITYSLLVHPAFEPLTTALLSGYTTLSDVPDTVLNSVDALLITGQSVSQRDLPRLSAFKQRGGVLLPDVLSEKSELSEEDIISLLTRDDGPSQDISSSFRRTTFDSHQVRATGPSWVVVSEQYSLYRGWRAFVDGAEVPILKADGIISAVNLPQGERTITFSYKPRSLFIGSILSLIFLIIAIAGLVHYSKDRIPQQRAEHTHETTPQRSQ